MRTKSSPLAFWAPVIFTPMAGSRTSDGYAVGIAHGRGRRPECHVHVRGNRRHCVPGGSGRLQCIAEYFVAMRCIWRGRNSDGETEARAFGRIACKDLVTRSVVRR